MAKKRLLQYLQWAGKNPEQAQYNLRQKPFFERANASLYPCFLLVRSKVRLIGKYKKYSGQHFRDGHATPPRKTAGTQIKTTLFLCGVAFGIFTLGVFGEQVPYFGE